MLYDLQNLLSGTYSAATLAPTGQSVNGAGSIVSTNSIDLNPLTLGANQIGDTGGGENINIVIHVTSAPTAGTSVQFQIIQADDAALTSNVQVITSTDAIPIASLPAGTRIPMRLDQAVPFAPKRYLGLRYVNVGAIATAAYMAGVVNSLQDNGRAFKTGYGVA